MRIQIKNSLASRLFGSQYSTKNSALVSLTMTATALFPRNAPVPADKKERTGERKGWWSRLAEPWEISQHPPASLKAYQTTELAERRHKGTGWIRTMRKLLKACFLYPGVQISWKWWVRGWTGDVLAWKKKWRSFPNLFFMSFFLLFSGKVCVWVVVGVSSRFSCCFTLIPTLCGSGYPFPAAGSKGVGKGESSLATHGYRTSMPSSSNASAVRGSLCYVLFLPR